jgi:hypothetical protein
VNDALNRFRLGVIAERQFAHTINSNELFGRDQWHARCEHLAERASVGTPTRYSPPSSTGGCRSPGTSSKHSTSPKRTNDHAHRCCNRARRRTDGGRARRYERQRRELIMTLTRS